MEKKILVLLSLCAVPAMSMDKQPEGPVVPPMRNPNRRLFEQRNPNQPIVINGYNINGITLWNSFNNENPPKNNIHIRYFETNNTNYKAPKGFPVPDFSCFEKEENNNKKNSPEEPNNTNYDYCPPTPSKKRTNSNDKNEYPQTPHKRDKK